MSPSAKVPEISRTTFRASPSATTSPRTGRRTKSACLYVLVGHRPRTRSAAVNAGRRGRCSTVSHAPATPSSPTALSTPTTSALPCHASPRTPSIRRPPHPHHNRHHALNRASRHGGPIDVLASRRAAQVQKGFGCVISLSQTCRGHAAKLRHSSGTSFSQGPRPGSDTPANARATRPATQEYAPLGTVLSAQRRSDPGYQPLRRRVWVDLPRRDPLHEFRHSRLARGAAYHLLKHHSLGHSE